MATAWVITEASDRIVLDATGRGEVTFTVTNPGPVQDRAVFDVVAEAGAGDDWFNVDEPQRLVAPGASVTILVRVAVPAGTATGSYTVQGRVYSADTAPEESSALSRRVGFDVAPTAPPKRSRPWWLIPIGVAVLLVLAVVLFIVLRGGGTVVMPDLAGLSQDQAEAQLEEDGLVVGEVTTRHDPNLTPGEVISQSVDPETEVEEGSEVDLEVAVTLTAPILLSPVDGTVLAAGSPVPRLFWEEVEGAAAYRVSLSRSTLCFIPLGSVREAPVQVTTTTSSILVVGFEEINRNLEVINDILVQCTNTVAVGAPQDVTGTNFDPSGVLDTQFANTFQWRVAPLDGAGTEGPAAQAQFAVRV